MNQILSIKNTAKYLFVLFFGLFCSSCNHDTYISDLGEQISQKNDSIYHSDEDSVTDSTKNVLPEKTNEDSLKILAIGNSFTDDATAYLPNLINNTNLSHIKIAKLVHGGTSLEYHYNHSLKNDDVYDFFISDGGKTFKNLGKSSFYKAICDDQWDIVVMQQVSQYSGLYYTYQPYLDSLIAFVHRQLPEAIIAWQMTWAYGSSSTHSGFKNYDKDQTKMFEAICDAVIKVYKETDIDFIIPSGMAIQKLRSTSVNNPPLDLTRDGYHLDYGAGRYTAACTWFEAIISKIYGTNLLGNTYHVKSGNVPVTDDNAFICQQAAADAVKEFTQYVSGSESQ